MKISNIIIILSLLVFGSVTLKSQILDVESTSEGILIPRMTEAQRNAIATPMEGTLIYQTNNTKGFYFYSGSSWTPLGGGGSNAVISANAFVSVAMQTRFGVFGKTNQLTEDNAHYPLSRSGTLKNLYVYPSAAVADGAAIEVFVRINGADTALGLIFNSGEGSLKTNLITNVAVSAGDLVSVRFEEINDVTPSVQFFVTFELE